ncbi:VOC family protein [Parvibaculaceae bacterium PLY_AMNH_Bact1]|nr:VOC family protein [Parvibaculaceae bacterium PLY_AMNH_Bact1]
MTANPTITHGMPSWIAHNSTDPAAARKFYESVLGWNVVDMPMQDGSSYPGIMVGDGPIGGIPNTPSNDPVWVVYITVDDVDQRFNAAVKAGAEEVSAPADAPGVGRMATIRDPFGASIAFISYEAPQG